MECPAEKSFIYGPVSSWRLGRSLGVDLISRKEKACSFDCPYCQIGRTGTLTRERKVYVTTDSVLEQIKNLPEIRLDHITFSGTGEPTLAMNLGSCIRRIRTIRSEPVAVITNSSLLHLDEVINCLLEADTVVAKLDACDERSLVMMNRPAPGIDFRTLLNGLSSFRKFFRGRFALQIMMTEDNRELMEQLRRIALAMDADEVQINTPLRPSRVKPLNRDDILSMKGLFPDDRCRTVYDPIPVKDTVPLDITATSLRRGKADR